MYKVIHLDAVDRDGDPNVFSLEALRDDTRGHLEKTASVKMGKITPEAKAFFADYPKSPKKLYLLANAVSVGEVYGANDNADYFARDDIDPPGQDANDPKCIGYKSFMHAGIYRHHKNKDRSRSFGRVIYSFLNPRMHRVELIIEVDPDLAQRFGHSDLVCAIREGKRLSVSMGCKVPYDECMHCGKKSKTTRDYCTHILFQKNKVFPDGTRASMKNPRPRFFDLSFVIVGGDPLAWTMVKLASAGTHLSAALAEDLAIWETDPGREPVVKLSARDKVAEIIKRVPAEAVNTVCGVADALPDLPPRGLIEAARSTRPVSLLSALASLGIMLRPREFQAVVMGSRPEYATSDILRSLDNGRVFRPGAPAVRVIRITLRRGAQLPRSLAAAALDRIPTRENLIGAMASRMFSPSYGMSKVASVGPPPGLAGISSMYSAYQAGVLGSLGEGVAPFEDGALSDLTRQLAGDSLAELEKTSGLYGANMALALPAALLYGMAVRGQEASTGEELRGAKKLVSDHPILAASVLAGVMAMAKPAMSSALRAI